MKRLLVLLLILATALWAAVSESPVKRSALAALEKSFDGWIEKMSGTDPFDLLGTTRGVYLKGYGAVFTAEVNLIVSPAVNPFRQSFSKEEITRVHARKLRQLPLLKENMREMLVSLATRLDSAPANEQIVLGISLFYYSWEDRTGLPSQIVMQAERQKLLNRATPDSAIRTEEF